MRNKWIAVIGAMMLFVVACGGSEAADVSTQVTQSAATPEPTETSEPTETTPAADETIIITATTAADSSVAAEADTESAPAEVAPVVASEIDFENSDVVLWFWAPW